MKGNAYVRLGDKLGGGWRNFDADNSFLDQEAMRGDEASNADSYKS